MPLGPVPGLAAGVPPIRERATYGWVRHVPTAFDRGHQGRTTGLGQCPEAVDLDVGRAAEAEVVNRELEAFSKRNRGQPSQVLERALDVRLPVGRVIGSGGRAVDRRFLGDPLDPSQRWEPMNPAPPVTRTFI